MTKVLVSFDDVVLRRIDRIAKARGLTRSAYLAELAELDARRVDGPGRSPTVRRTLVVLDELFAQSSAGDSTATVRAERDAR